MTGLLRFYFLIVLSFCILPLQAQNAAELDFMPTTAAIYDLVKKAPIKDPDQDTYVKINAQLVVDREETKKPYFITGDDGLRKRIDLYRVIQRDSMKQIGVLILYSNEKGKRFLSCLPTHLSNGEVWEKYFADIHQIDREEPNFVLKLSYVLSREYATALSRAGKQDAVTESATYGNEICFSNGVAILRQNSEEDSKEEGNQHLLQMVSVANVLAGNRVGVWNRTLGRYQVDEVVEVKAHPAKNYAITAVWLAKEDCKELDAAIEVRLQIKKIEATPNHPIVPVEGAAERFGELGPLMKLAVFSNQAEEQNTAQSQAQSSELESWTIVFVKHYTGPVQQVFSVQTKSHQPLLLNGVLVEQK